MGNSGAAMVGKEQIKPEGDRNRNVCRYLIVSF